jgi:hypothetical protein
MKYKHELRLALVVTLLCCILYPSQSGADDYKAVHKYIQENLTAKNKPFVIVHQWNIGNRETQYLSLLTLDKAGKQPLIVGPEDKMIFLGPPGAFLRRLTSDASAETLMLSKVTIEDFKKDKVLMYTFKRKGLLYLGYYYPHKYTGEPLKPEADSKIYLYFFKPEFLKEPKNIKGETNTSFNDADKQEVIPYNKDIEIKPLNQSDVTSLPGWSVVIAFLIFLSVGTMCVRKYGFKNIDTPGTPSSMRFLFECGTKNFFCIHCGKQLKIKGKFECRLGHVPDQEQYIFETCGVRIDGKKCPDVFEYMRCNNCGEEIALNENNYNREEIENRGKEYILRTSPHKEKAALIVGASVMASIVVSSVVSVLFTVPLVDENLCAIDVYKFIYGQWEYMKHFTPAVFYIGFVVILGLIIFLYERFGTEDIIVKNPYVKRKI